MFTLKRSGTEETITSVTELEHRLREDCCGDHVSVIFFNPTTLFKRILYLSITDAGEVFHSYGAEERFDFTTLPSA